MIENGVVLYKLYEGVILSPVATTLRLSKPGQHRLCWVSQKRAGKRVYTRRLKDSETKYMPLETLTPMALEIDRRALTNSVGRDEDCQASFTSCYHAERIPLLRSRIQMG